MATVEGREALRRKLLALPDAVRREMKAALEKSAQELVGMQQRLAPVRTGKLRDSIGYEIEEDGMKATISAGGGDAFYARFVEFGTQAHEAGGERPGAEIPAVPARAFFFPAYRALKKRIRSRSTRAVSMGIRKVAKGG